MVCATVLALLIASRCIAAVIKDGKRATDLIGSLRFTSDGTFQLSIFEDLHYGENAWDSWGPQQDVNSAIVMNEILNKETQQLVVLNGDLITGENQYLHNATANIDVLVKPLVQRGLTWASTYGNHDSAFNLSREAILLKERSYPNARTFSMVPGPTAGVSNYYLLVYPSDGGWTPSLILWFFDSRGGSYFQQTSSTGGTVGQPDWVDESVVSWFQETNHMLQTAHGGKVIPSLAFVHIPTNASQALQTEAGVDPHRQPGINDDYILAQQAQGWCTDGSNTDTCVYGGQDVQFMKALVSIEGLMAVFSGHDHGDTWCYKWDTLLPGMTVKGNGLNICFGQHSGYGGYGNWARGSRQVLLSEATLASGRFISDTWIRLETGDVVGHVSLNETYGTDNYPATPDMLTFCPTCNYTIVTPMPGTR